MLMVVLAVGLPRLNTTGQAESSPVIATESARNIPAQSDARLSVEPIPLHEEIRRRLEAAPMERTRRTHRGVDTRATNSSKGDPLR